MTASRNHGSGALRRPYACALLVLAVVATSIAAAPAQGVVVVGSTVTASELLAELRVEADSTVPFESASFREDADLDGDGCGSHFDRLLSSDSGAGRDGCTIVSGRWTDPWSLETIEASGSAPDLRVVNFVSSEEAWKSGAQTWTDDQRMWFANDVKAMLTVTPATALARGTKDPSAWIPERTSPRCMYVANWIGVKFSWSLSIDESEKAAIERVLDTCPTHITTVPPIQSVPQAPPPLFVVVHRFYSPVFRGHFYTIDNAEKDAIIARWPDVWSYEGTRFTALSAQVRAAIPVYRFWSERLHGHFYTSNQTERDHVMRTWPETWSYEGIAYYALKWDDPHAQGMPLFRFWNARAGHHFYTANVSERDHIVKTWPDDWAYEGVAFHVPISGLP